MLRQKLRKMKNLHGQSESQRNKTLLAKNEALSKEIAILKTRNSELQAQLESGGGMTKNKASTGKVEKQLEEVTNDVTNFNINLIN